MLESIKFWGNFLVGDLILCRLLYQIIVSCPTGYKVGGTAMNQWVTNWGDGLVYGAEIWDDANSVSGDGWTSDWTTVEDEWIWLNGSTTHKSDWSKWDAGYEPNSQKLKWKAAETSFEISILLIIFAVIQKKIDKIYL